MNGNALMARIAGASIVVTGASSGVGRATALALADHGARLTLAARGREALERVASECTERGGPAVAVPTDISDSDATVKLAEAAASTFGGLDAWINVVGVGAFGRFEETPIEAHRRVIETNLIGAVNGAHAAIPYFRAQGQGILINVNSLGAWVPSPYSAAYAAGKWGLLGFSKSLRAELSRSRGIAVCDVFPSFLNTPGLDHAANYTGRELAAAPPVYEPEAVANAIVNLIQRPRSEVTVGVPAKLAWLLGTMAPGLAGWLAGRAIAVYLNRASTVPITDGNLFESGGGTNRVHGRQTAQNRKLLGAGLGTVALAAALGMAPRLLRGAPSATPGRAGS